MHSEDVVVDESVGLEFGEAVDACADESYMPPALPDEVEKRIEAHIEAFDPLLSEICAPENNLGDRYFHEFDIEALGTPPEAPSGEPCNQASGGRAWRKFRFGSYVLEEAYRILSRKVFEVDLGCLFATDTSGDATSVIVCNFWRLTKRVNSPEIHIEIRDFDSGGWIAGDESALPEIPLLPGTPKRRLARECLHRAVNMFAHRYHGHTTAERTVLAEAVESDVFIWALPDALADAKVRSLEKRLGAKKLNSLSETLSKIIWTRLIDPAFIKVVGYAMMLRRVSFSDYIYAARSHTLWTKFYEKERKLLPVLTRMPKEELEKPEPFSIKRWTEDGVQVGWWEKTLLAGPASYRALIGTHPAIVRGWAEMSCRCSAFATLFDLQAIIADDGKIPQPVMWSILGALGSCVWWRLEPHELTSLARLIRQYVRECKRRRSLPEFRTYRNAIDSIGLRPVLDWWANAGMPVGEPNRQTKWSGIERKSNLWHGEVWRAPVKSKKLVWESLICACIISGVEVEPLTSSDALIAEGKTMQHCASAYDVRCERGSYRIFSLKGATGERTTLALVHATDRWSVDQHYSAANGSISSSMAALGKEIARLYTKVGRGAGSHRDRYAEPDILF